MGTHSATNLRNAISEASEGLVERGALAELVVLAAVAGEHVLVIGPPGTAKSEAVRRVTEALGGTRFEYLVGRFTEPQELFGPIDLQKLKQGRVEVDPTGMLPEAEIAFLDEIFLGSTAILNTLLGILNERTFRRGHSAMKCPLRVCVGAANALPEEGALAAFADRFLVRAFIEPVSDAMLEELLAATAHPRPASPVGSRMADLAVVADEARAVDVSPVRSDVAHAVRLLRGASIVLSDRRASRVQRLVAAAAALSGRGTATRADLWPIIYAIPTADAQTAGRELLRDLLVDARSEALPLASEEASAGPAARAARLVKAVELALGERSTDVTAGSAWRARLEGLAREIDAGFAHASLPIDLGVARAKLVDALAAPS